MKYKMKFFGSATGAVTRRVRHFDQGQIIEAPQGEFNESTAEAIEEERKIVEIEGQPVETASKKSWKKK